MSRSLWIVTCYEEVLLGALRTKKRNQGEEEMTTQAQTPPAHVSIMQLLNGAHVAGAVSCLADLGISDLREAGPKSAGELTGQTGDQPTSPLPSHAGHRLCRSSGGGT
jgi:hypothetical protein